MVIVKNNILRMFRSVPRLALLFLMPIIFSLIFTMPSNISAPKIAIIDRDNTELSADLINTLSRSNKRIMIQEARINDYLINAKIDYALYIEEGFEYNIRNGQVPNLSEHYYIDGGKIFSIKERISSFVDIALNYSSLGVMGRDIVPFERIILDNNMGVRTLSVIGFLIQFMVYASVITAAYLLIDYENKSLLRIASSPMGRFRYMMEHMISYSIVITIQIIVALLVQQEIMGIINLGAMGWAIILLLVLLGIALIGLGLIVVTLVRSEKASSFVIMVVATPLVILGGCYFPIETLPNWMQELGKLLPIYWAMDGAKTLLNQGTLSEVSSNIVVLAAFGVLFYTLSSISSRRLGID